MLSCLLMTDESPLSLPLEKITGHMDASFTTANSRKLRGFIPTTRDVSEVVSPGDDDLLAHGAERLVLKAPLEAESVEDVLAGSHPCTSRAHSLQTHGTDILSFQVLLRGEWECEHCLIFLPQTFPGRGVHFLQWS